MELLIVKIKTMENLETKNDSKTYDINRLGYIGLLSVGIIFLFLRDWSTAAIMLGIALVFDPFNTKIAFGKRPFWQRAWLIIHLTLVFGVFGIEIFS